MRSMTFEIQEEKGRIDKVLTQLTDMSRSKIQKLLQDGKILVNGVAVSNHYQVNPLDQITIEEEERQTALKALDIPLDIVYEDEYLLIINKPSGLVVHPAAGHYDDTLVNALLSHYDHTIDSTNLRPGIVHRLDKDTSGLMVVAKNDKMLELLSELLKNKQVKRHYLAIVDGVIVPDSGTIDAPIGRDKNNRLKMKVTSENSKEAITDFKVLKRFAKHTFIECILRTGRTHQIRVHLEYIGHPVSNDPLYGNHKHTTEFGQMLHSKSIDFIEPITNKTLYFEAKPPKEFGQMLASCENETDRV